MFARLFMIAALFDYKWLKTFAWPIYFTNLGLLAVTLVIGKGVGGSSRWVSIGGIQFQFSELAKILIAAGGRPSEGARNVHEAGGGERRAKG